MLFPKSWFGFFDWVEHSWLGKMVAESLWQFATIEAIHLLALSVIGGAILIVDLRLLGWTLKRQPVAQIARDAEPYLFWSLLMMIVTGIPLMASLAASKYYVNLAFQLKMFFLLAAIVYTYTIRRRVIYRDDTQISPITAKLTAIVSVLLWSGVGIMGRGIGFY
jgi:hypothetical protein